MPAKKWTPELLDRLAEMIDAGYTYHTCAEALGTTTSAICNVAKKYGLVDTEEATRPPQLVSKGWRCPPSLREVYTLAVSRPWRL